MPSSPPSLPRGKFSMPWHGWLKELGCMIRCSSAVRFSFFVLFPFLSDLFCFLCFLFFEVVSFCFQEQISMWISACFRLRVWMCLTFLCLLFKTAASTKTYFLTLLPIDSGHGGQLTDALGKEADSKEGTYAFASSNQVVTLHDSYLLPPHSDIPCGLWQQWRYYWCCMSVSVILCYMIYQYIYDCADVNISSVRNSIKLSLSRCLLDVGWR